MKVVKDGPMCRHLDRLKKENKMEGIGESNETAINSDLENRFMHHVPKDGQGSTYETIRDRAKSLAYQITALVPASREQSLALTNLEQVMFWANAGIARN